MAITTERINSYPRGVVISNFNFALESLGFKIRGFKKGSLSPEARVIQEGYDDTVYSLRQALNKHNMLPDNLTETPHFRIGHKFSKDHGIYYFDEPVRVDPLLDHLGRRLQSSEFIGELTDQALGTRVNLVRILDVLEKNSRPHWITCIEDRGDLKRNARIEYEAGFLMCSKTATRGTSGSESNWFEAIRRLEAQKGLVMPVKP